MDQDARVAYNSQLEAALADEADGYTGEPLSKWMPTVNSSMARNEDPNEGRGVFVVSRGRQGDGVGESVRVRRGGCGSVNVNKGRAGSVSGGQGKGVGVVRAGGGAGWDCSFKGACRDTCVMSGEI